MKRRMYAGLALILPLLIVGFTVLPVSAHVLKTDGDMQLLLHVDPNDTPVSGGQSSLILFFDDSTNRFALANCICRITVQENAKTLTTLDVPATYPTTSQNPYVFPNPDVYSVQVTGRPKQPGGFQPFSLTYLVRVTPGPDYVRNQTIVRLVIIGLSVTTVVGAATSLYLVFNGKRSREEEEKE